MSFTLQQLGAPTRRGICFSCDAMRGMDVAEDVARRVGRAATWYSVGILSSQRELALQFAEFCQRHNFETLFHAIDLDMCGTEPLDVRVLREIAARAAELRAPWVNADLAMWVRGGEALLESLVPMPLVDESVSWAADRVKRMQDVMGVPVAIENPPYPFIVGDGDILQLMSRIAEQADCLMTIDVGHLYGLRRQRSQPLIAQSDDDLAWDRVVESHLSGTWLRHYPQHVTVVDDKHDWPVAPDVWELALALMPRARNLRAIVLEAESLLAEALAEQVLRLANTYQPFLETTLSMSAGEA